ncbi:MAG TPA: PH domain-containing protein [Polyangiaceae bacterium LLY-WYZ-15_(1-7)]|nr:PH domain-containing protein [Polyangiaceae bacterium LLY-WYZ-15_(1-7)]HJL10770.1 PH domain-containing protein [Polyangiaceae bacterium LLY-WYZ-15_(1-7)]
MAPLGDGFEQLDEKVVWYWRAAAVPRVLALLVPVSIGLIASFGRERTATALWVVGLVGAAGLAWALGTIVFARLRFRRFAFRLAGGVLHVRRGVFVHREKIIPVDRMQHLDVDRGPVERAFGLARLSVFTAGGRGATFQLPGLPPERAYALRQRILATRGPAPAPGPQEPGVDRPDPFALQTGAAAPPPHAAQPSAPPRPPASQSPAPHAAPPPAPQPPAPQPPAPQPPAPQPPAPQSPAPQSPAPPQRTREPVAPPAAPRTSAGSDATTPSHPPAPGQPPPGPSAPEPPDRDPEP